MKRCVCGTTMTKHEWKHQYVCHACGRTKLIDDSRERLQELISDLSEDEVLDLIRILEDKY